MRAPTQHDRTRHKAEAGYTFPRNTFSIAPLRTRCHPEGRAFCGPKDPCIPNSATAA